MRPMKTAMHELDNRTGLRGWQHGLVFLIACGVILSRRPDAIFHAQFYAEDAHVWYADAYNLGWWPALFRTWTGYFLTLPRLAAALALLAPFSLVPLTLNLIAIPFQALPANLLLASRSSTWGKLRFRALLAATYLVLPNCFEVSLGITDANWLLALSALLVLVASLPRGSLSRGLDLILLLLCGLSGPFCMFLLPISVFLAWKSRERWRWVGAGIFSLACFVQSWALLFLAPAARPHSPMGANPILFLRILGGQIYLATLLGGNTLATARGLGAATFLACSAIVGTGIVALCFQKSNLAMRTFLLFTGMVLLASLVSPAGFALPGVSVWQQLTMVSGVRYWYFPTLGFAWALIWCMHQSNQIFRRTAGALLCMMCIGVVHDWRHPVFADMHFAEYTRRFEAAPVGTKIIIPVNPAGWNTLLIKR